jgi:predicted Rossmann fold nucleotide-binding protein DprA/Smf involved in DNA uptake
VQISSLNPDSEAIASLCARFPGVESEKPLSAREWGALSARLADAGVSPEHLLELAPGDFTEQLGIGSPEAERLERLLERRSRLTADLARLAVQDIWLLTLADPDYPARWRKRLGKRCPPLLFGVGEKALLETGGVAIVGSRRVSQAGRDFAREIAEYCAHAGLGVVSGGARGVDAIAMGAAMQSGGFVVGVMAHALEKALREPEVRRSAAEGRMLLVSPYHPRAPFNVGNAMARNKLIYALADYALVVASDLEKGGTWAGATEALRKRWVPLFVREAAVAPAGNRALLARGGISFPDPFEGDLEEFLRSTRPLQSDLSSQPRLF